VSVVTREQPAHPALVHHVEERAGSVQNRIADAITAFAGSMWFVYLHVVWFAVWLAFGIEAYPYGLLTMIVSLEAIFLSTFVMISQNRQDDARRHLADMEWTKIQEEDEQNRRLIELSTQILEMTDAIRRLAEAPTKGSTLPPPEPR
jgi:uncharacterized membrane protein